MISVTRLPRSSSIQASRFTPWKLLGHTQIKTTQRYSHISPEILLNAADSAANSAKLGVLKVLA